MADDTNNADVGGRYAQALFELADSQGRLAQVEGDLKALEGARKDNADLRRLLASPTYDSEQKSAGLTAIAKAGGADPLTLKFLGLLSANNRASALPAVAKSFAALAARKRGAVAAEVTSATPLTDAQQAGLKSSLRQSLGKDPELTIRVDPSLLGGLKVRVGSRLYDASLKGRLDQLKTALKRA